MDKVLVCIECSQESDLRINLEGDKQQENFVDYVEDYFA